MRVDLLIIALRLDKYSAGIYSTAESMLNTLFLMPNTISYVIVPVLSHLFATDIRQAWKTAWRSLLVLALIGLVLFLVAPDRRPLDHAHPRSGLPGDGSGPANPERGHPIPFFKLRAGCNLGSNQPADQALLGAIHIRYNQYRAKPVHCRSHRDSWGGCGLYHHGNRINFRVQHASDTHMAQLHHLLTMIYRTHNNAHQYLTPQRALIL